MRYVLRCYLHVPTCVIYSPPDSLIFALIPVHVDPVATEAASCPHGREN